MNLVVWVPAASAEDKLADLSSVLGELRKGGLVIYLRHGSTDQTGSSEEAADLMKCETQRNLSAEGRMQATEIGKAMQALRIPVGTVTTSPFCRTKDTAELAFGRFTVSTTSTSPSEPRPLKQSESRNRCAGCCRLRGTIALAPAAEL